MKVQVFVATAALLASFSLASCAPSFVMGNQQVFNGNNKGVRVASSSTHTTHSLHAKGYSAAERSALDGIVIGSSQNATPKSKSEE